MSATEFDAATVWLVLFQTRTLFSYLFPCFIYKEYALRKSRGPEQGTATVVVSRQRADVQQEQPREPRDGHREKMLANVRGNSGFSRTVDPESPLLADHDAATPSSLELHCLSSAKSSNLRRDGNHPGMAMMSCSMPTFPIREHVSPVHGARSIDDQGKEDGSSTCEPHDRQSGCHVHAPYWLWSTVKFYATTKAKFFYHVVRPLMFSLLFLNASSEVT